MERLKYRNSYYLLLLILLVLVSACDTHPGYVKLQITDATQPSEQTCITLALPLRNGNFSLSVQGEIDGSAGLQIFIKGQQLLQSLDIIGPAILKTIEEPEMWADSVRVVYEPQQVKSGHLIIVIHCG